MAETRARKIARRATKAVVADTINSAGELSVNAVKVYNSILNLPTSGNSVGDLAFTYRNANLDMGAGVTEKLYIWVGNDETDYGGWYQVPIHAFNYNKDD